MISRGCDYPWGFSIASMPCSIDRTADGRFPMKSARKRKGS